MRKMKLTELKRLIREALAGGGDDVDAGAGDEVRDIISDMNEKISKQFNAYAKQLYMTATTKAQTMLKDKRVSVDKRGNEDTRGPGIIVNARVKAGPEGEHDVLIDVQLDSGKLVKNLMWYDVADSAGSVAQPWDTDYDDDVDDDAKLVQ